MIIRLFILLFILLSTTTLKAQNNKYVEPDRYGNEVVDAKEIGGRKKDKKQKKKAKPLIAAEVMPSFPGGDKAMAKFIKTKQKYPKQTKKNGVEGRCVVRFVVDEKGKISDIEVLRSLDRWCEKEVKRIVKSMPRWIPGKKNGENVSVYYTISIIFRLPEEARGENHIYQRVDEEPQFKEDMNKYLNATIDIKALDSIQGVITMKFVIEKDGSVSNISVVKSPDPICDKLFEEAFKTMPILAPGKVKGKAVCCWREVCTRINLNK